MAPSQQQLYDAAVAEYRLAFDRLAAGYEVNVEKRRDLRQEIHFQLWRSFGVYDGRCSLKTWCFRVAHNTAVSYVDRERRSGLFVELEEIEEPSAYGKGIDQIDKDRSLARLHELIHRLKPMDRQIMLSYLEGMDNGAIAEITGLSIANVGMKIHRIKNVLTQRFGRERQRA